MAYNFEKEKREAIDAGNKALESLHTAKENLDSAHNWGLFDMFAGGLIWTLRPMIFSLLPTGSLTAFS